MNARFQSMQDEYLAKRFGAVPWGIEFRGQMWAGATDGHVCALTRDIAPLAPIADAKAATNIADWLTQPESRSVVMSWSDAEAFAFVGAGERPCVDCEGTRQRECATCDGAGEKTCECSSCGDEHEATCDDCGGAGHIKCSTCSDTTEKSYARLLGYPINRQKLRIALEAVATPGEDVRVAFTSERIGMFLLQPDSPEPRWLAVVMGLKATTVGVITVDFNKPETWRVAEKVG